MTKFKKQRPGAVRAKTDDSKSFLLSDVLIIPLFTGVTIKETQMKAASTFFLPSGAGRQRDLCEAACGPSIPIDEAPYKS